MGQIAQHGQFEKVDVAGQIGEMQVRQAFAMQRLIATGLPADSLSIRLGKVRSPQAGYDNFEAPLGAGVDSDRGQIRVLSGEFEA